MKSFTIAILFAAIFTGINAKAQTTDKLLNTKIDSIISLLTLDEKVAMFHAQSKFSTPGVERLGMLPKIFRKK